MSYWTRKIFPRDTLMVDGKPYFVFTQAFKFKSQNDYNSFLARMGFVAP